MKQKLKLSALFILLWRFSEHNSMGCSTSTHYLLTWLCDSLCIFSFSQPNWYIIFTMANSVKSSKKLSRIHCDSYSVISTQEYGEISNHYIASSLVNSHLVQNSSTCDLVIIAEIYGPRIALLTYRGIFKCRSSSLIYII